jgi:membrane-associated phospholipid phosphatase
MYAYNKESRVRVLWFFGLSVFFSLLVSVGAIVSGKAAFFERVRMSAFSWADIVARYLTHAGDGTAAIVIGLVLLLGRMRAGYLVLISYATSGILAQILKRLAKAPRPAPFFAAMGRELSPADGVELLQAYNSFPSGHAATAFSLAASLVLVTAFWNRFWYGAFGLAVLVGYTRVHLGQHFPEDVAAGAILGVSCAATCYLLLRKHSPRWMSGANWML